MISEKMQSAINDQINFELYSSYIYLALSNNFEQLNFTGMAHWMRIQANEELFHAMKLYDFIQQRDGKVTLSPIDLPDSSAWQTPLALFEVAYNHEQLVSSRIYKLMDISLSEKDYFANTMLQWFVNEQLEEENNVRTIIDRIKRIETMPDAMYRLDAELGARVLPATVNLINTSGTPAN